MRDDRPEIRRVEIAIHGGGPAALVLAIGLARRGIRSLVLDAEPDRARGEVVLLPRVLEILRRLGVLDPLIRQGRVDGVVAIGGGGQDRAPLRCDLRPLRDVTACNFALRLPAESLERVLVAAAAGTGLVEFRSGSVGRRRAGELRYQVSARRADAILSVDDVRDIPGTEASGGDANVDLDAAHSLVWKLDALLAGHGDPDLLLGSCKAEGRRGPDPLVALRHRVDRLSRRPAWMRGIVHAVLSRGTTLGFDRALARHVSMLSTRYEASPILFQDRALVGWRMPDVAVPGGRLHDLVGRWGLILVNCDDPAVAEPARAIGRALDIATASLPPAFAGTCYGQCDTLYIRPDHVIGLQSGGLQPLRLDDVRAALGWLA